MKALNLNKLNSGLTRIVSVRERPPRRRVTVLPSRRGGRVFRLTELHRRALDETTLRRNRRGYTAGSVNTVAHAPSLYHWLFHRCGVPFAETQARVRAGALRVNGTTITDLGDCEVQLPWSTFQQMDVQLRTTVARVCAAHRRAHAPQGDDDKSSNNSNNETNAVKEEEGGEAVWVPALQRALHREYFFVHTRPGVSLWSDEGEPRSFVHLLSPHLGDTAAALGLNVLRPIGFCNGMYGLALASNDVAAVRYWNNNCLGNYGVFDVRFARGVPRSVVRSLAAEVREVLATTVRPTLPRGLPLHHAPPCTCTLARVPDTTTTSTTMAAPGDGSRRADVDVVAQQFAGVALHDERLLVSTPQMPFRLAVRLRRATGRITLVRSGPFVLPAALLTRRFRALTPSELAVFYTFERRLKVNRVLLSLHEFDTDMDDDVDVDVDAAGRASLEDECDEHAAAAAVE